MQKAPVAYAHPYHRTDVSDVLTRLYKVGEYTWAVGDTAYTNLAKVQFPGALYAIPNITAKLEQFQWLRADVEVTVKINATEFHNGALVVSSASHYCNAPAAVVRDLRCDHALQRFQLEDATVMLASSVNSATLLIRRSGPRHYEDAHGAGIGEIGTLFIDVLHPLKNQAGTTPAPVHITVFARFVEPEVAGYTATPTTPAEIRMRVKRLPANLATSGTMEKHSNDPLVEARKKSEGGIISGVAEAVSSFTPLLAASPLAELAPFAGLGGLAAPFLKSLGLDKPTSQQAAQPVFNAQYRDMAQGHGLSQTPKLSLHPEATLGPTMQSGFKDWTIQDLIRRPSMICSSSFDKTQAVDTPFLHFPVLPSLCAYTPGTLSYRFYPTYLAYFSQMFRRWRGSMKMHVKFVCARFTTARVRITHLPNSSFPASFETYAGDMVSTVVDVRGSTDFSLTLPYYHEFDYADTAGYCSPALFGDADWTAFNYSVLPHVAFTLVNPVAAPSSTDDTTIYYSIWFSAGNDFTFGNFVGHVHLPTQTRSLPVPAIEDVPPALARRIAPRVAPASAVPIKFEKHSLARTFAQTFPGLGEARGSVETGFVLPEKYSSIYDLVHRFERTTPPVIDIGENAYFWQKLLDYTEEGYTPPYTGRTTLKRLASLFAFWRGGMRFLALPEDPTAMVVQSFSTTIARDEGPYACPQRTIAADTARLAFEVPWDNNSFCRPMYVEFNDDINTPFEPFFTFMNVLGAAPSAYFALMSSVAEDFQFGLLRPCPYENGDLA